jgi:hypothetical protein
LASDVQVQEQIGWLTSLAFSLLCYQISLETQQSTTDFDANGNLLTLDNIGILKWHYNNTLNQLTKADKSNTTQYYVYVGF